MIQLERLDAVMISAFFDGFNGGIDGAVTGDDDDFRIRAQFFNPFQNRHAICVRHFQIRENQMKSLAGHLLEKGFDRGECFDIVGTVARVFPCLFQGFFQAASDNPFIIDDCNADVHQASPLQFRNRQINRKRRAAIHLALHFNISPMFFDQRICYRQAQTCPPANRLCRIKRLKNMFQIFRLDADSRILNRDFDGIVQACGMR